MELNLDPTKVALATSEGETTAAQAVTTDAQACIVGKDFPYLVVLMDVHGL